jgi:hypothetical protein
VLKAGDNPAQGVKLLGLAALGGALRSSRRQWPAADPRHGGREPVRRQVARVLRHEPVAGAARRRLHRRLHNIGVLALVGGMISWNIAIPIYAGVFPRRQRRARPSSRGRRPGNGGVCDLGAQVRYLGVGAMLSAASGR